MTRIRDLIGRCSVAEDITFEVIEEGGRDFVRVVWKEEGSKDWFGRKWRLSPCMTDGEVVQTVFKAMLTFLEHELREKFTFDGVAVFGPHLDIHRLVEIARDTVERTPHHDDRYAA